MHPFSAFITGLLTTPFILRFESSFSILPQTITAIQPFGFSSSAFVKPGLFFHIKKTPVHTISCNTSWFLHILLLGGYISLNPGPGPNFGFTNIRSIKNKSAPLSNFITTSGLTIVGLIETWVLPNDTDSKLKELTPEGYRFLQVPRPHRWGGGVGFFVHNNFEANTLNSTTYNSFEHIIVSVKSGNVVTNFVSLYKPPRSAFLTFINEFLQLVECLSTYPSDFVICGDFNLHTDKQNTYTLKFLSLPESCNLIQHINFSTHLHNHTLDLLITPSGFKHLSNFQSCDAFSDHFMICAYLDISHPSITKNKIEYRKSHKIDVSLLKEDLLTSDPGGGGAAQPFFGTHDWTKKRVKRGCFFLSTT